MGRPICGAAIEQNGAELERDDAERELLQNRRAESGMLAAQAQLRLDLLFPGVEIVLNFARENLAELGVDAADVGGQRHDAGQQDEQEDR